MSRNIEIKVRLSKEERQRLDRNVRKTTLSREGYIRQLINGYEPQPVPPMDYYDVIRELRMIGSVIQRLSYEALPVDQELHRVYTAHTKRLWEICDRLQDVFINRKKTE